MRAGLLTLLPVLPLMACGDQRTPPPDLDRQGVAKHPATVTDAATDTDFQPARDGDLQMFTVRFEARVGSAKFACGESYPDLGTTGARAAPVDFRFFVQDVRLLDADEREVALVMDDRAPWQTPELALIAFAGDQGGCTAAASTNQVITASAPPGDYEGIVFRVGVPEDMNHVNPVLAPAPLQAPGVSWGWLAGFRFMLAELVELPADAAARDARPGRGLLHLGSTSCAGDPGDDTVRCERPNRVDVRLTDFDPDQSVVVADIAALFADTDLSKESLCHSGATQADCPAVLARLGLDPASGAPAGSQVVFRIE